ncbi:hypothetical protein C1893_27160 [Pseudomonas sp. MPR-ANC1]|nr:hypothetical protein C1893_27160 [Pseudomonas sp. MPR-ANC1]
MVRELAPAGSRSGPRFFDRSGLLRSPAGASALATESLPEIKKAPPPQRCGTFFRLADQLATLSF